MADRQNCVRVTNPAKRGAALRNAEDRSPNRKRVALGKLPNLSNVVVSKNPSLKSELQNPKGPKGKAETKVKKPLLLKSAKNDDGEGYVDVDAKSKDPQMCGSYVSDIYKYHHNMEVDPKRRPLPDYIEKVQKDVDENARGILVNWLAKIAERHKLVPDTLHLTITYVDRYLSLKVLDKERLQLLGLSSMLIAVKHEETRPDIVEAIRNEPPDNPYTKDEVVKMEADILKALNWELGYPTIKTFLGRFTRVAQEDYKTSNLRLEFLGYYLAELSLLDYACVKFLPSLVAASVIFLARFIIRAERHPWSSTLQKSTNYKPSDIKECVLLIHDLYLSRKGGPLQAVREKYKQHEFKCVATMPSSPEIPVSYFEDI